MRTTVLSLLAALLLGANSFAYDTAPAFSPDGQLLAFVRAERPEDPPVIVISPTSKPDCRVLASGKHPRFNPDGEHLLYLVESPDKIAPAAWKKFGIYTRHTDIYMTRLDGTETRQLTKQGGASPIWSADGGEIAYLDPAGYLCRLPFHGGNPKKITNRIPCLNCLAWLPDFSSFAATQIVKGKIARYAFSPPSRTPVRISKEFSVPADALAPSLDYLGHKFAYMMKKPSSDTGESPEIELWAAWHGGKRKVAEIPLETTLSTQDVKQLWIIWSPDSKLVAASCAGKIWVVELATNTVRLISGPVAEQQKPETKEEEPETTHQETMELMNSEQ